MGGRIGVLTVVEGSTDEEAARRCYAYRCNQPKYVSSEQVSRRRNQPKESFKTTSIK